jgi:hypothetical protein
MNNMLPRCENLGTVGGIIKLCSEFILHSARAFQAPPQRQPLGATQLHSANNESEASGHPRVK